MAGRGFEFYLRVLKVSLTSEPSGHVMFSLFHRYGWHFHILWMKFQNNRLCLSGKLSWHLLTILVTMATPLSSHVKDRNSIFWYFISIYDIKINKFVFVCQDLLWFKNCENPASCSSNSRSSRSILSFPRSALSPIRARKHRLVCLHRISLFISNSKFKKRPYLRKFNILVSYAWGFRTVYRNSLSWSRETAAIIWKHSIATIAQKIYLCQNTFFSTTGGLIHLNPYCTKL